MTNLPPSAPLSGRAPPGILEHSVSLLSAAMDASARAEGITSLASALDTVHAGLDNVLEPVIAQHTENAWSGNAAVRSRRALAHNNQILWRVARNTAVMVAELQLLARQAAEDAERCWEEWRIAIYKGEALASLSFSG